MRHVNIQTYFNALSEPAQLEQILIGTIVIFLLLSLVLFISIMLYRSIKIADIKYIDSLTNTYDDLFMTAAFSDSEELKAVIERTKVANHRHLKRKRHAHIITNKLLFLYNSFSGESRKNLLELYMRSGFVEYSEKKMHSTYWELKAQGIREVAEMKDTRVLGALKKISKKRNKLLKENAQLSLLKINGFAGLDFLSDTDMPLSDWHQINLIETLKEYRNTPLPDFSVWLSSGENTVVLFAIRLINYFKQIETSDKLIPLLEHSNEKIRTETIRALGVLNKTDAIQYLIEVYDNQPLVLKTEIIKAYALLAEQKNTAVLLQWLSQSSDPEIQRHCLEALIALGATNDLKNLKTEDHALKEVANSLINSYNK